MLVRCRRQPGLVEISQLALELFPDGWGRGQTRSPVTREEGRSHCSPTPQVLQRSADRRLQFLTAYNLLLKI